MGSAWPARRCGILRVRRGAVQQPTRIETHANGVPADDLDKAARLSASPDDECVTSPRFGT
jgi:hypothetical protein